MLLQLTEYEFIVKTIALGNWKEENQSSWVLLFSQDGAVNRLLLNVNINKMIIRLRFLLFLLFPFTSK